MLIPRESPYLKGLNSYYLHLDRLVEHMQGEIGSGCVHCSAPGKEMLVYFTEQELISCLIQDSDQPVAESVSFATVQDAFIRASFVVQIFQIAPHAIFFWAQMPPFQRASASLRSSEIPLPDLIFRLRMKQFSGFIDVQLVEKKDSAILFFHEGERIGGSYTWGSGGLSTTNEDYNTLLSRVQSAEGIFTFGSYLRKGAQDVETEKLS
ncbi:MAG: hypothetical protein ACOX5Z_00620 [Desulfobulbus sp.]|jgi:hypothetical protein